MRCLLLEAPRVVTVLSYTGNDLEELNAAGCSFEPLPGFFGSDAFALFRLRDRVILLHRNLDGQIGTKAEPEDLRTGPYCSRSSNEENLI